MQKTKNPLIFFVENSDVYKDLIVGYLTSHNFTNIKVYEKGEDCLADFEPNPDLIILTYGSSGMTGLEFMTRVSKEYPTIDFIFLSSQNDVEVAVQIMKLGAADYIVKNDNAPQRLVTSIQKLIKATHKKKQIKGFRIGVLGFFIMMTIVIVVILLLSIFLGSEV